MLLSCGGDKPAHAVRSPVCSFREFGERRAFGSAQHLQNSGTFAFGTWCYVLGGCFRRFLAAAALLLGLGVLDGWLAFGRGLLRVAPFFEEGFPGATLAPCSLTLAAVSFVSELFML
jgi:hypothetical protein